MRADGVVRQSQLLRESRDGVPGAAQQAQQPHLRLAQ